MSVPVIPEGDDACLMDDSLSIINPFPKLLEGPVLLHQLISGPQNDAVALDYTDAEGKQTCLSYSELHARAEKLASRLLQHRPADSKTRTAIVPLYIPQCPSLYISILAILKSGAAFCPLNLDVPEERLRFILKDTSAQVLLTTSQMRPNVPELQGVAIISVDEEDAQAENSVHREFTLQPVFALKNPLAYIMYTSGSTGLPKAVCLPHLAVTQSLLAHDRHIPAFTRFLQFASPTFDVSVFEIFFPWIRGSTLVSCDRGRLLSDLPSMITSLNIDAAELTPSVAASLVRKRDNVPTLKTLLTIGEMLNVQVIQEFGGSESKPSMLYGMYGPTEAAIHCTLQPKFGVDMPAGNIGIPLDTVSCFVVKPAETPEMAGVIDILPIGEVGELAVGGHQLALGYLNREEQTRAAFVSDPRFGDLYRTGDKAIIHSHGLLECRGRISSGQVKLRGQRIELGEIEHAASKVSGCHAVVASVLDGQLIVFCIVEDNAVTVDDVKNACRKWLPNYMVPNDVMLLEDFPYLPSGKVDKRGLESHYKSKLIQSTFDDHGASVDLKRLIQVLSRVLHVEIGSSTDLGSAGLDSLRAIQVASELRREGHDNIGALDLLAVRTARDLESLVRPNELGSAVAHELTASKQQLLKELKAAVLESLSNQRLESDVQEVVPCTPLQDAMLSETARNPQAYCNAVRLSLPSETDLDQLKGHLHLLAERHPLLRSGFCVSGSPISAYSQLTWENINDSQIMLVDAFDSAFSMQSQEMLLRPLRFQCRKAIDYVELSLQIHHALYDQWSIEILIDDLSSLLREGDVPSRPAFGDVNDYFLDLKLSPDSQSQSLEFWQGYLSAALPGRLPNLRDKALPVGPLAVAKHTMDVDMPEIRRIAHHSGCSPHVFFQATYFYLLSTYMGSSDALFGTVFSGRTLPIANIENIFGPILSTLPTRMNVSEARKFSDLLRQLHGNNRDIMQHSTVSLADIRKVSPASPGQALFDSIFVWQETARAPQEGKNVVDVVDTRDYLEFNLTLELEPYEGGVNAKATYQPSVLSAEIVETLFRQLEQITRHVMKDPETLVSDLDQLLPNSLLSIANPEPQNFVYQQGLGSVLEKHAEQSPDKLALCFASNIDEETCITESLTYSELNAKANKLAHFLISAGTLPDELVCICMDKSVDLYIGILAIVKTGAGYLPLVPETPPARIRQILSDAKVKTCLVDDVTSNLIEDIGCCRAVNAVTTDVSSLPDSNPQVQFDPSNLAYAVFTSGTTGKPKGVLVTQENILSNLTVLESIYPYSNESRFLQACNQAFDVSVFEIFFSWYVGICLCSATKDVLFRDLENAINQLDITHLSLTPTVAALVDPVNVPKVHLLVTAGEAVTHQVHKAWADKGLYQGYGPSETTNICTVNPAVGSKHVINNIGPAFENTSTFVLANCPEFRPLPTCALGELCFGGQQVFRGYQNMAELTASKIIDHEDYGRIYRSGDLGRLLPDGTILIEGRIDDQRKLRGQRIELGEISSVLLRSTNVHDCSIQIVGANKQQERLVAFWVPTSRAAQEYSIVKLDEALRREIDLLFNVLSDELPAYMIPAILVPLTAIPRTSQGKIDRRRLTHDVQELTPELANGFSQAFENSSDGEMLSDTECALLSALAEVLQLPQSSISRGTSFFAIGLDSVSAIRFSRAIKTSLGVQVDVSTILKRSSIARLAAAIKEMSSSFSMTDPEPPISSLKAFLDSKLRAQIFEDLERHDKTIQAILPCTPLQEAMLSASSGSSVAAYYNRTLFRLSSDISQMRQCWRLMLERHGILRTAFAATEDARYPYLQVVLAVADLPWEERVGEIDDLESLLQPKSDDEAVPVLGFQPPYKLKVYKSKEASHILLEMHHAMYDANAMSNLLQDIEMAHRGASLPSPSDFAPFLGYMLSTDLKAVDAFFNSHLHGYVPKPFTKVTTERTQSGFGVIKTQLQVPQDIVHAFLRKQNISLLALVQATWAKVLSASQSQPDVCFGNVVSGRSVPVDGVQSLVAPCLNTVPVRIDLALSQSNLALAKALQRINVDLLPYQLASLRRIQATSSVDGLRLFDSLVLLQQEPVALDGSIWSLEGESGEMDFPCIVEVGPIEDRFDLLLHFDRSYFGDGDVPQRLCTAFVAAFNSCITYPASGVSDFIEFDKQEVSGLLKPDENVLHRAEASMSEKNSRHDTKALAEENWSSLELKIRDAFSIISGTPEDRISRDTTIYRIGLDSISAIQIAGRLRTQGINLTAGDIMESPSCSQLASAVQSQTSTPVKNSPAFDLKAFDHRHREPILTALHIHDTEISAVRPCTAVQSGMISQYLQSDGEQYLNHTFYLLDVDTSAEHMAEALNAVIASHDMLRTGFSGTDDGSHPFAMITYREVSSKSVWLRFDDATFSTDPFNTRQRAAEKAIQRDLQFPPWRWSLFVHDGKKCLQFSAHHAIFDAETLRLIQADLRQALIGNGIASRESIDSALSLIVANSAQGKDAQRTFWAKQLQDLSVTRFPVLTPVRVLEQEASVVSNLCKLSRSMLEAKCRELGVSLQVAGQAAWARLLAAYTGESRVTFGVVSSGRTTPETASCAFPCITTLPVTADASHMDKKLLQDLITYNAAIQRHQFTPLTDIHKYADSPTEALFDTLFAYQKSLSEDDVTSMWQIIHEDATVDYAISIEMEALPKDKLGFRLTINSTQVPIHQGQMMLQQLESLLMAILGTPTAEYAELLSIVPANDPVLPTRIQYLHQMFESSASKFRDRIALEFVSDREDEHVTSRCWSYEQLDEESNRVAQLLVSHGVKPNGVVATSFDKCPEAFFAFLGILKAGCAFCAIDPTAPIARKTFILEDSNASILLTTGSIVFELSDSSTCEVIDITSSHELNSLPCEPVPAPELLPSSVSYVLYTSGTTGTPKGCELTHDNAVQAMLAFQRLFKDRVTEKSRWLQFASYHFDVAVVEQFWTWSVGIRLVCAPRDLILEDLAGFIDTLQITHLDLTPSLGRLLDPTLVPTLHQGVFITGGESLKQDMINNWGDIGCLFNFYGPTECTIGVTTFPSVPCQGKPSNIGWQFDNVGVYVLAPGTKEPVLRGAIGELCISGRLVGKGYLNRPELTADCFPYLEAFGERVYRTGDLVRLLHDNSIDFLGRKDNQVKLRGQRLEIDEIEAVVRQCPEIEDVVCLVAKHPKQQKDLLVGFIAVSPKRKQGVPQASPPESTREMISAARTACEERLPGYMVPTHFIPIEVIPLSVNNKVEEKQLRHLYGTLTTTAIQSYSALPEDQQPLNESERVIARALATLLKIDASDLHENSNMFSLGLSSISAIQFSRKLKSEGFEGAQVATVMKNATIGKLSRALKSSSRQDGGEVVAAKQYISACQQRYMSLAARISGGKNDDYEAIAPCTALQQGIISRSINSDSLLYFNAFRYYFQDIKKDKLRSMFQYAVEKAQILRTAFIETDDGYVQAVRRKMPLVWLELDTTSEKTTEEILHDRRLKWRSSNSPHLVSPFEVVSVQTPTETIVEVHIHHALYDGIAYDLLIQNVTRLYNGYEADFGKSFIEVLPYGPLRNVSSAKEFWLDHLAGADRVPMPSLSQEAEGDTLYSTNLNQLTSADNLRRSLNVTLQAVIQASWAATLKRYHQGAMGNVVSGRSIDFDGAETVLGPLFNTIPFNPCFVGDDTWKTLVHRCHNFNISALPYQHTPIRDITKWCRASPSEPLFDTLFVFQNAGPSTSDEPLFIEQEDTQFQADYPLSFEAEELANGKLRVTISAKQSICSQVNAGQLVEEFGHALSTMASDPEAKIGESLGHDFTHIKNVPTQRIIGQDLNGVHDFAWSADALLLRAEIASLAAVDETDVDEHVSIFELGLDSVDAVKLSSRLKKKGLTVAVSALMRLQTIPRITSILTDAKPSGLSDSVKKILPTSELRLADYAQDKLCGAKDVERILPASPMQEGLISEMIKSSYEAYFNHDVLSIPEEVDLTRLEKAWATVVRASPILRTGFLQIDNPDLDVTFAQVIRNPCDFRFDKVQLSANDFGDELKKIQKSFSTGPLSAPHFELTLVATPSGRYLILSVAHALYDGYSLSLLHSDVYEAYFDHFKPRPIYDEVLEQALYASDSDAASFWSSLLSGATRTHIASGPGLEHQETVTYRKEKVSSISSEAIASFCRKQGVTIQSLCQTVWAFALAYETKLLDVLYGVVQAGRDSQVAGEVMFPTMNTVIMRAVLHGSRKEMLQYMQGTIADITEHQHFPLRKIQAACQKEVRSVNSSASDAFFDSLFTYQKRPDAEVKRSTVLYESVNGASDVDYPVAIEAEALDDHLIWRTACKSDLFSENGTEEMLDRLDNVLNEIVTRPESPCLYFEGQGVSICGLPAFLKASADANAKPSPSAESDQASEDSTSWSPQESEIRRVIAQVTRTPEDEITKRASIQNLGVDSINAIKISSLLRKKEIKITVSEIVRAGSIVNMIALLHGKDPQTVSSRVPSDQVLATFRSQTGFTAEQFGFHDEDVQEMLPVTAGQVYMLSVWQKTLGQVFYPEFEYILKGNIAPDAIRKGWKGLTTQHEILRTIFCATEDENAPFVQLVMRKATGPCVDLDNNEKISEAETEQPFARLSMRKMSGGFQIGLKIHHALYDAISLPLLMADLEQQIKSLTNPTRQRGFSDFLALSINEDASKSRQAFWTQYLQGVQATQLKAFSALSSSKRVESFDPAVMPINEQNEASLRKQGLSLQALFFAAYAKAYIGIAEQGSESNDVVIGIWLANRSHMDDLSSLVAPTVNLVPLRVRNPKNKNIVSITKQVQEDLQQIGDPENSSAGLWEVEKWTGVKVDAFINFIKLPDQADAERRNGNGDAEEIIIEEAGNGRKTKKRSLVHEASTAVFKQPKELEKNIVQAAYPASLDIEATVANGALGIGVFGWQDMIGLEEAEEMIKEIIDGLREVFEA